MLMMIDNYDSFTYNLYQALAPLHPDIQIVTHDALSLPQLIARKPTHLLISPGPGSPREAGISTEAIRYFAGKIPVLGVCLGHQCLAYAFGGRITRAPRLMHGKTSAIYHARQHLFASMPQPFTATRYHSLVVQKASLPDDFTITAWTQADEIMGLYHGPTGAQGIQFHPESILTQQGHVLLKAFIQSPSPPPAKIPNVYPPKSMITTLGLA